MHRIIYLFLAWAISSAIIFALVKINKKFNKKTLRRLGGLGMALSFIITTFLVGEIFLTAQIKVILAGSFLILLFGIWDDFKNLSWKIQLLFQLFLVGLVLAAGFQIDYITILNDQVLRLDNWQIIIFGGTLSVFSLIFIAGWFLAIMNSINWIDGIDGLAGLIGIFGALAIFLVSLRPEVNQPALAILSLIFAGCILGFWHFNFPVSRIIAGSGGSYFIGFVLAALAIMAGTKIATILLVLALPIIDAGWVIYGRWKDEKSIFKGDVQSRHLHYQLKNYGWSNRKIFLMYSVFLSSMLAIGLFCSDRIYKIGILLVESILIFLFLIFIDKKIRKTNGKRTAF